MTRPYIDWNPAHNAGLELPRDAGPYHFDDDDLDRFAQVVGLAPSHPVLLTQISRIHAVQARRLLQTGSADLTGLRTDMWDVLPKGEEYFTTDAANGEPTPLGIDDVLAERYITLAHKMPVRGWIGSMAAGFPGNTEVRWADPTSRTVAAPRGLWSGVLVSTVQASVNAVLGRTHAYSVHGKQLAAANWEHRGGTLPGVLEAAAVHQPLATGKQLVVVDGNDPAALPLRSFYDNAGWQALRVDVVDATVGGAVPVDEIAIAAWVVMGAAAVYVWPAGAVAPIWVPELEIPMLEPWVINGAQWEWRDITDALLPYKFLAYVDPLAIFGTPFAAVPDLRHPPMGHGNAPLVLRESDADLGVAVRMGVDSTLFAAGRHEIEDGNPLPRMPILLADKALFTLDVPYGVATQIKIDEDADLTGLHNITCFGDIQRAAPNANLNGVGIYISGDTVFLKYYNAGWQTLSKTFPTDWLKGRPLNLAWAFTGDQGSLSGYDSRTIRLLVNGQVVDAPAAQGVNDLASTEICFVGHSDLSVSTPGFKGLFGGLVAWMGDVTDDEIRRAFEDRTVVTDTLTFDDAGEAAGDADGVVWAERVAGDRSARFLQSPWAAPEEPFDWLDKPAQITLNGPTWDFSTGGHSGAVVVVQPNPVNKIHIVGDHTALLPIGVGIQITGSTGLDAFWTVAGTAFAAGNTEIEVVETVLSAVADGTVTIPPLWEFDVDVWGTQYVQHWASYYAVPAAATTDELADTINGYVQHAWARARGDDVIVESERQGALITLSITEVGGATYTATGADVGALSATWDDVVQEGAPYKPDLEETRETFTWTDIFDLFSGVDAEYRSYYEVDHGISAPRDLPRDTDTFDEGWGGDSLTTTLRANTVMERNGRFYGTALTFPMQIPANRNLVHVLSAEAGAVVQLALTPGTYATAALLAAELQAKWAAAVAGTVLAWGWETVDSITRLWFGWDGSSAIAVQIPMALASGVGLFEGRDARASIGMYGLGPNGSHAEIPAPEAALLGVAPPWDLTELYGVQVATAWNVKTITNSFDAVEMPFPADTAAAAFDAIIAALDYYERFKPAAWGGAWIDPSTYAWASPAQYDTDLGPGEPVEDFEEGW